MCILFTFFKIMAHPMKKRTTLFLTEKMDLCTANYLPKGI